MSENLAVEKQIDEILSTAMILDSSKVSLVQNDSLSFNNIDEQIDDDNLKWGNIDIYILNL